MVLFVTIFGDSKATEKMLPKGSTWVGKLKGNRPLIFLSTF